MEEKLRNLVEYLRKAEVKDNDIGVAFKAGNLNELGQWHEGRGCGFLLAASWLEEILNQESVAGELSPPVQTIP